MKVEFRPSKSTEPLCYVFPSPCSVHCGLPAFGRGHASPSHMISPPQHLAPLPGYLLLNSCHHRPTHRRLRCASQHCFL